jgi:hypothetical protein
VIVITSLAWNELLAIALAIGLTLFVVIGLIVTNPKRRNR